MVKKLVIFSILLLVITNLVWAAEIGGNLTLDRAIELALENSSGLEEARELYQQRKKDLELYSSKYRYNFDFNLSSHYSLLEKERNKSFITSQDKTDLNIIKQISANSSLNLYKTLVEYDSFEEEFNFFEQGKLAYQHYLFREYDGVKEYDNQLFAREIAYIEAKEEIKKLKAETKFAVIDNYYNLLKLEEQISLEQKNLEQAKEVLKIIEAKVEAGQALALDQRQAELEVDNRKIALKRLNSQSNLALRKLANTLEVKLAKDIRLNREEKIDFSYSQPDIEEIVKENSYEIKLLTKMIEKQDRKIDYLQTKKDYSLKAIGEVGWSENEFANDYRLGIEFNYNWNTFRNKVKQEEVNTEELNLAQLKSDLANLNRDLSLKVEQKFFNFKNAKEELDYLQTKIENKKQSLEIAELKYEKGLIRVSDLFAEQLNLLAKEKEEIENISDYNLQAYRLKKLMRRLD